MGSVGSGALVLVEVLVLDVLVLEVVGGSVVVGGAVLVVVCRRPLVVGGAEAVEVVGRLVLGTTTAGRGRVVVGSTEVAGETRSRWASVVVVCWVACADCLGEVVRPTMLPPIAPISIAATTLTQRRAATKRTGLKRRTPPVQAS